MQQLCCIIKIYVRHFTRIILCIVLATNTMASVWNDDAKIFLHLLDLRWHSGTRVDDPFTLTLMCSLARTWIFACKSNKSSVRKHFFSISLSFARCHKFAKRFNFSVPSKCGYLFVFFFFLYFVTFFVIYFFFVTVWSCITFWHF